MTTNSLSPSAEPTQEWVEEQSPIIAFLGLAPADFASVSRAVTAHAGSGVDCRNSIDDETLESLYLSGQLPVVVLGPGFELADFPQTLTALQGVEPELTGVLLLGLRPTERPALEPRQIAHLDSQLPDSDKLAELLTTTLRSVLEAKAAQAQSLYRVEALNAHQGARDVYGDPLLDDPGWARWSLTILLVGLMLALLGVSVIKLPHYSEGPAIIQTAGRTELAALESGVLQQLLVKPGQTVETGQLLASLYGPGQEAEVRRLEEEFLLHLRKRLLDPTAADHELIRSRTSYQIEKERLARHEVRSTADGRVLSVLASTGEFLEAGRPAILVDSEPTSLLVAAFLPGKDHPTLETGQTMLLELDGYRDTVLSVVTDEVASEAVSADSAQHAIGATLRDILHAEGSVVLVRGKLPQSTIESHGHTYPILGGMPGLARVKIHSEPLLFALIPSLERIFQREESGTKIETPLENRLEPSRATPKGSHSHDSAQAHGPADSEESTP